MADEAEESMAEKAEDSMAKEAEVIKANEAEDSMAEVILLLLGFPPSSVSW